MRASRERVNRKKDLQVFKRTAAKTRAINVGSSPMRGGIRL